MPALLDEEPTPRSRASAPLAMLTARCTGSKMSDSSNDASEV